MKFEEFKQNVEQWATVRGIYEQSTEAHQQAKALEEIGEYLTAETDEERMDAIGDIAVCIVNAAEFDPDGFYDFKGVEEGGHIMNVALDVTGGYYVDAMRCLNATANRDGLNFEDCLAQAWNEIKDRKGMMVNGKYVKWDNLSDEQRAEFERRNDHV